MNTKYFGQGKSRGELELITLAKIPQEYRELEADLYLSKWYDYRLLHPAQATYYLAHCYETAVRDSFAQTHDRDQSSTLKPLSSPDIFEARDALTMWIARQHLDRIGCRYEFAMRFTMNRFAERGWRMCPRPNQLYGEELVWDIADAWKVECRTSLQFPKSEFFREHAEGPAARVQHAYQAWICDQAKNRGPDTWRPLSRLLGERVIDTGLAEREFGREATLKAKRVVL